MYRESYCKSCEAYTISFASFIEIYCNIPLSQKLRQHQKRITFVILIQPIRDLEYWTIQKKNGGLQPFRVNLPIEGNSDSL